MNWNPIFVIPFKNKDVLKLSKNAFCFQVYSPTKSKESLENNCARETV